MSDRGVPLTDDERFQFVERLADKAASDWRSIAEAAYRGDPLTLRVHCKKVSILTKAAFTYVKRISRREYIRVAVRPSAEGFPEAVKFPRDGTGFLTSLVETDGLVELGESIEKVELGQIVNFLPYQSLE